MAASEPAPAAPPSRMIFACPSAAARRPGDRRWQSFLLDVWRGDAKPPAGNRGGDDHRSRGERAAALREPQPARVCGGVPHYVQRDDFHEAFLTLACAIICWRRLRNLSLCEDL